MASNGSPLGVGVLGLGFMGRLHIAALRAAEGAGLPCRLAAVCDGDPQRLRGGGPKAGTIPGSDEPLFDPALVRGHRTPAELFADSDVDLVHICTWTDTHVDLAIAALAAGKHVVVEKPVAVRSLDVERLLKAARASDRLCMPAMCMRFWPGWTWLKTRIETGEFGPVRSASFRRLGSAPSWTGFYADESRSGGALFDLHIHDVDFITWCFGAPDSVHTTGTSTHLTTLYRYRNGPAHVSAEGGWSLSPSAGFRMQYLVCFEGATAEFDLSRTPTTTLHRGDRSEPVEIPALGGYDAEVAAAVRAVASGNRAGLPTLEEALTVTRLLEAERASLMG